MCVDVISLFYVVIFHSSLIIFVFLFVSLSLSLFPPTVVVSFFLFIPLVELFYSSQSHSFVARPPIFVVVLLSPSLVQGGGVFLPLPFF